LFAINVAACDFCFVFIIFVQHSTKSILLIVNSTNYFYCHHQGDAEPVTLLWTTESCGCWLKVPTSTA